MRCWEACYGPRERKGVFEGSAEGDPAACGLCPRQVRPDQSARRSTVWKDALMAVPALKDPGQVSAVSSGFSAARFPTRMRTPQVSRFPLMLFAALKKVQLRS